MEESGKRRRRAGIFESVGRGGILSRTRGYYVEISNARVNIIDHAGVYNNVRLNDPGRGAGRGHLYGGVEFPELAPVI